jgi:hypothetical protein
MKTLAKAIVLIMIAGVPAQAGTYNRQMFIDAEIARSRASRDLADAITEHYSRIPGLLSEAMLDIAASCRSDAASARELADRMSEPDFRFTRSNLIDMRNAFRKFVRQTSPKWTAIHPEKIQQLIKAHENLVLEIAIYCDEEIKRLPAPKAKHSSKSARTLIKTI